MLPGDKAADHCANMCKLCNCAEKAEKDYEELKAKMEKLRGKARQYIQVTKHLGPCPGTLDELEEALKETD